MPLRVMAARFTLVTIRPRSCLAVTLATVSLDEGDEGLLGLHGAGGTALLLAARERLIGFDDFIRAIERTVSGCAVHGLADAVAEKPSGLVGHAGHMGCLGRTHVLL